MMDDVTQPKKGNKVATTKIDLAALPYKQLVAMLEEANALVHSKRKDELKEITKTFVDSLVAAGFSKQEGIEALGSKAASGTPVKSRPKAGKGGGVDIPREMWGKTFTNAATGETWTKSASGKGKPKQWLVDAINGGKTLAELLAK
jgi:hypothetical protein